MDIKQQTDYIINQIFPIEEGMGAMIGGLAIITILASITGIAYDKLSKMTKDQINKLANKNNVSISKSNKPIEKSNTPIKSNYEFNNGLSNKVKESDVKTYITAFDQIMKELSSEIKKIGCKSNPIIKKNIIEYNNAVEYKCQCVLLDVSDNISSLEKFAIKKGYDIDDEDEHDGEIINCIEDEIIKNIKNFKSSMSRTYTHNKYPINIEFHGNDLDYLTIDLIMDIVVKK